VTHRLRGTLLWRSPGEAGAGSRGERRGTHAAFPFRALADRQRVAHCTGRARRSAPFFELHANPHNMFNVTSTTILPIVAWPSMSRCIAGRNRPWACLSVPRALRLHYEKGVAPLGCRLGTTAQPATARGGSRAPSRHLCEALSQRPWLEAARSRRLPSGLQKFWLLEKPSP
jgi:hypothetical protein